jgi:hypothetical protein
MVDWVSDNTEWLFSGVLVAVPLAILAAILERRRRSGSRHTQRQWAGRGSTLLQAGRDIMLPAGDELTDGRAARSVIDFLADQRVLHQPLDRENPQHCVKSAIRIRQELTSVVDRLGTGSAVRDPVLRIRQAANTFCTDADAYLAAGGNLWIGLPQGRLYVDPDTGRTEVLETYDNSNVPDFEHALRIFRTATAREVRALQRLAT